MLDLQIVLETAGFDYAKFTMLMHTTGFFKCVEGNDPASLTMLVDRNIALFERSKGFGEIRNKNSLELLLRDLSKSLGDWTVVANITQRQLYGCVNGKDLKAFTIMNSLQYGKENFIACSSRFENDMNKFIDAVAKKAGISKS